MYYIGIDLGGTNIAIGLVNTEGEIVKDKSIPTLKERGIEVICQDMIELCKDLMRQNNLTKEDIHSIGIGTPGTVDSEKGIIVYANNIAIDNFPITKIMRDSLDIPVYVANDADCAALGEVTAGAAKGCTNAVILTLGTGVGGGLVLNGEIYKSSFPGAGELGHHVIAYDGRQCNCGRKGCFEVYGSATALISDAQEAAKNNPDSKLNYYIGGDISKMNAKIPFDAAQGGDVIAQGVVDQYLNYLACGISNVINIFKPEMIIIGGGVSRQKENLTQPLTQKVSQQIYAQEMQTKIEVATLGNDAGIIGAAMLGK
ncbi:MAG TPA: ROK family protein [Epulopiscium sp.]|nr:ROK family protein [Candidatus Epulonipiscium sp.]